MAKYKLGDICEIVSGSTPKTRRDEYWDGNIKWITPAELNDNTYIITDSVRKITELAVKETGLSSFPEGTVILSSRAPIGRGATFKEISKGIVSEIEINVPGKEKQEDVVAILEKVSGIIELRKQELATLDDFIRAGFVEMFGNPDINPKGWNECPLSDKLNVLGGYAFKSEQYDVNDGIPVLRIGNINAGYFKPVNMVYWQEDKSLERYVMYPGDLVMSLTGTVGKDDYGNVCILGNDYRMYYLNQRNAKLEIKEGIDKYYLSQLLRFEQIKKRLTGISRGVRQANISNRDILNLIVPVPPIELQNQFADFVSQTDKSLFVMLS